MTSILSLRSKDKELDEVPDKLDIPKDWGIVNTKALHSAVSRGSEWHGMYSNIPLLCKGGECQFKTTCYSWINKEINTGERCIPEMAMVINLTQNYIETLQVAMDNYVDLTFIKDIVSTDIAIERCNKFMADSDLMVHVPVAINSKGDVVYADNLNEAYKFVDKLVQKRIKILSALNATRADKAKSGASNAMNISKMLLEAKKALEGKLTKEE